VRPHAAPDTPATRDVEAALWIRRTVSFGVLIVGVMCAPGCDSAALDDAGVPPGRDGGPESSDGGLTPPLDSGTEMRVDAGPEVRVDASMPDAGRDDAGTDAGTPPPADFCEAGGILAMEAEAYSEQVGFAEVRRDDASGSVAMQVGDSGVLSFEIYVETAGTWYFWPRTFAPDSESNGLHVEIDGVRMTAPASSRHAGTDDIYLRKSVSQWFWDPLWQGSGSGPSAVSGPVTFELSAGVHTFSILKRIIERPLIDRIVLTTSSTAPTGLGPSETSCR